MGTAAVAPSAAGLGEGDLYQSSSDYLGLRKVMRRRPSLASRQDVHATILQGVPYGALIFLLEGTQALNEHDITQALGISARTLRRHRETPEKPMPVELASRAWQFSETLAKAAEVMGSRGKAEEWMSRPAAGLDGQRPIDLLQTLQGAEVVNDFLGRLEYGVYT